MPVTFSTVTGADNYRIEWSKNVDFTGALTQTTTQTSSTITAPDSGTYNVRVRAFIGTTTGRPSDPGQFTILTDQTLTGDDPTTAAPLGFGAGASQTVSGLNIVPAGDEDWFAFKACRDDQVSVATHAQSLNPPSELNTLLRLYDNAGTMVLAANDDSSGTTTDSYLETVLPPTATDTFRIQVSGVANTVGTYELVLSVTAGVWNSGTDCILPQPDTVIINPATVDFDAVGAAAQLTAIALDANGDTSPNQPFTWATDSPSVALVDGNGLVTSTGNGVATVTATAPTTTSDRSFTLRASTGPNFATAAITVQQVAVAIQISPPQDTIKFLGGTAQFAADVLDRLGSPLGTTPAWSSSDPGIATVDTLGLATAVAPGSATITASFDTVTAGVTLAVIQDFFGLDKVGGDAQTGFAGSTLPESLAVRVHDGGSGSPGAAVCGPVPGGGGAISPTSSVTDGAGISRAAWTLGGAGGAQTVSATADTMSVDFTAQAVTGILWANALGGNWSNPTNWNPAVVPGAGDTVLIGLAGDYTVDVDIPVTVARLTLSDGTGNQQQTLATAASSLTVTERFDVALGGLFTPSSNTLNADTLFVAGGIFSDGGTLNVTQFTNNGVYST
ncbi:MAG: Ig-like domain-containing protein, partial [Gemmatimonadales bacterium]